MFLVKVTDLKFVKNVKVNVVMRQHNVWCVCVPSVWRCVRDCSPAHIFKQNARTHQMLCCRITTLTFIILYYIIF